MSAPASAEAKYSGSCHCGQVKYEASLPAESSTWELSRCNCTICHKKGYLSIRVPNPKTFKLVSPDSLNEVGDYQFGRKTGHHYFCKNCGTSLFGLGYVPELGGDYAMLNASTVDDVDLSKNKINKYWDGRSENWMQGTQTEPVAPGMW